MARLNKETVITELLSLLEQGKTHSEVLALNGTKWQLAERTFNRYWKDAQTKHKEALVSRQQQLLEQGDAAALERQEAGLMDLNEALTILTDIARGKAAIVAGELIMPSPLDRISAIRESAKMQGWQAPKKMQLLLGADAEDEYEDD